ncbi:AAA family ATPase [Streptomyces sp. NPDC060205]|uniref:AAA family ATPase n=1 Tax=Streptomyces sp. NPDC060205 TaxID=3347072 RepID=UPI0036531615
MSQNGKARGTLDPVPLAREDAQQGGVGGGGRRWVPVEFVGRSHSLALLAAARERARAGQPQRVLVEGPAGIGKTALVRRFLSDDARVPDDGRVLGDTRVGQPDGGLPLPCPRLGGAGNRATSHDVPACARGPGSGSRHAHAGATCRTPVPCDRARSAPAPAP